MSRFTAHTVLYAFAVTNSLLIWHIDMTRIISMRGHVAHNDLWPSRVYRTIFRCWFKSDSERPFEIPREAFGERHINAMNPCQSNITGWLSKQTRDKQIFVMSWNIQQTWLAQCVLSRQVLQCGPQARLKLSQCTFGASFISRYLISLWYGWVIKFMSTQCRNWFS